MFRPSSILSARTSVPAPTQAAAVPTRRVALADIANTYRQPLGPSAALKKPADPIRRPSFSVYQQPTQVSSGAAPALSLPKTASSLIAPTISAPVTSRPATSTSVAKLLSVVVEKDRHDPLANAEYVEEIMSYLYEREATFRCPMYMSTQPEISEKMRSILVDWLASVHLKFRLQPETFFLGIKLLDTYLSLKPVSRQKLQLMGMVALQIACKVEEIYSPRMKDWVYMCDKAYTEQEILRTERAMLGVLSWNVSVPTVFPFLKRFCKVASVDSKTTQVAFYLTELALGDYKMLKYLPSEIAAAAVFLAMKMNGQRSWTSLLEQHSRYSEASLSACVRDLRELRKAADIASLQAIRKKYSSSRYEHAALVALPLSL